MDTKTAGMLRRAFLCVFVSLVFHGEQLKPRHIASDGQARQRAAAEQHGRATRGA